MSEEQRKIAVTGANGFIGSHCVVALLEAGYEVIAVVRDPTQASKTKFLEEEASKIGKRDNLSFGAGDLLKEGSYDDAFEGTWGVVHTAAAVVLWGVDDPYMAIVEPAVAGTKNVVGSVKKHAATIKRLVNISSVAAVDMSPDTPDGKIFTEDDWNTWSTVENGGAYGYAKTKAEKLIADDEELHACLESIVSVNPSVVIGPCFTLSHAQSGSPSTITSVLTGEPWGLWPTVHLVDVRDVAKGVILALQQDKGIVGNRRFILTGRTDPYTPQELNDTIQKFNPEAKGTKIVTNTEPVVMPKYGFDISLSRTVLGIGEYRTFEETCKDASDSIQALLSAAKEAEDAEK